jgi:hypothetical protein
MRRRESVRVLREQIDGIASAVDDPEDVHLEIDDAGFRLAKRESGDFEEGLGRQGPRTGVMRTSRALV